MWLSKNLKSKRLDFKLKFILCKLLFIIVWFIEQKWATTANDISF